MSEPTIITRAEVGLPPITLPPIGRPVPLQVVHHTAGNLPDSIEHEAAIVRACERFHVQSKGMRVVAYNWLIGPSGRCYEGRGWAVQGGHTLGLNDVAHGVCFIGTFISALPSADALAAFIALVRQGVALGHVTSPVRLVDHRAAVAAKEATSCCGSRLIELVPTLASAINAELTTPPKPPEAPVPDLLIIAPADMGGAVFARYPTGVVAHLGPTEFRLVSPKVPAAAVGTLVNDTDGHAELARLLAAAGE